MPDQDAQPNQRVPRTPFLVACAVVALFSLTFAVIAHFARAPAPPPAATTAR